MKFFGKWYIILFDLDKKWEVMLCWKLSKVEDEVQAMRAHFIFKFHFIIFFYSFILCFNELSGAYGKGLGKCTRRGKTWVRSTHNTFCFFFFFLLFFSFQFPYFLLKFDCCCFSHTKCTWHSWCKHCIWLRGLGLKPNAPLYFNYLFFSSFSFSFLFFSFTLYFHF